MLRALFSIMCFQQLNQYTIMLMTSLPSWEFGFIDVAINILGITLWVFPESESGTHCLGSH